MAVVADLAVLVVVDDALVALIDVVVPTVVHAARLERVLVAVVVGRAGLGEVELVALGVVVGEGVRVLVPWGPGESVAAQCDCGGEVGGSGFDLLPRVCLSLDRLTPYCAAL